MKTITKRSLDELAKEMPVLSEMDLRGMVGGTGTFTEEEFWSMYITNEWEGGQVEGWGTLEKSYGSVSMISGEIYIDGKNKDGELAPDFLEDEDTGFQDDPFATDSGFSDDSGIVDDYESYTYSEFEELCKQGVWEGGYVNGKYISDNADEFYETDSEGKYSDAQQIIQNALSYYGTDYKWGGTSTSGIDCSGLITKACGLEERWTTSQGSIPGFNEVACENPDFLKNLQAGDILVWKSTNGQTGHAAIYVGNGLILHASSSQGVSITSDLQKYWIATKGCPTVYRK